MAQSLVSRIGASPLWRAGLASAFILGLAGFAAGVIPQACRNGFVICTASAPVKLPAAEAAVPSPVEAAPAAEVPAPAISSAEPAATAEIAPLEPQAPLETAMVEREPASIARNDLIAQTFAALEMTLGTAASELTARKVRTVAIDADGMPVADGSEDETQVAAASSAEPAAEASSEEPAPVQIAEAEEPEPVASSEEPAEQAVEKNEPSAVAYAPVRGGTAVVGRQGGNVRSLPQTKGSDVLFALARGSEVTIVEMHKGWAKIVDDRGRSGWIWDDLLTRP